MAEKSQSLNTFYTQISFTHKKCPVRKLHFEPGIFILRYFSKIFCLALAL